MTKFKFTLLSCIAILFCNSTAFSAETLSEDAFELGEDGNAFWKVTVTCEGNKSVKPAILQPVDGNQPWCAEKDQKLCDASKTKLAKQVCSADFLNKIAKKKPSPKPKPAVQEKPVVKQADPKPATTPEVKDIPVVKKDEPAVVKPTTVSPKISTAVDKPKVDPYANERIRLSKMRRELEQRKNELRNRELELEKRAAAIEQ